MLFYAITALVNAVASTALCLFVYLKNRRLRVNQTFALFCLSAAFWSYGYYFWQMSDNEDSALLWSKILMLGAILIALFYFHFILAFLDLLEKRRKLLIFSYFIFLAFFFIDLASIFIEDLGFLFVKNIEPELSFKFWPKPGLLYHPFLLFWLSYVVYCTHLLYIHYKNSVGIKKAQIRYVLSGITIGFIGGSTNYFLWYGIPIPPIGNLLVVVYVGATAYAILRYRLMDIRVVIRQTTVYAVSFLSILVLALAFHFLVDFLLTPSVLLEILVIAAISAGLFYPLNNFYLKTANKYFFAALYSYEEAIRQLSSKLVTILDLRKLSITITKELIGVMKLDRVGVLIRDEETGKYHIEYIVGFKEDNGISLVRDDFLTQWLKEHQRPLVYDELALQIRDVPNKKVKDKLRQLQANMKRIEARVCLPLMSRQKITGLIVLGSKLGGEAYSKQDMDLLEALVNQASLAIENARLHDRLQDLNLHLQERVDEQVSEIKKLLRAREELLKIKEDFLHIVSHQLRTPVSIFWGLLDNWRTGEIKEYTEKERKEIQEQVIIAAGRLKNVINDMLDALELGRFMELKFEPADILSLLDEVVSTLKPNYQKKGLYLKIEKVSERLPLVEVYPRFIKQALLNLIDNAEKYTQKGGTTIKLSSEPGHILIEIKDTGIGLTPEETKKLFKTQFFRGERARSLIPDGSGLGLYIVKQIIEKHQGSLEVKSAGPGQGTSFIIKLPLKQAKGRTIKSKLKI